MAEKNTTIEFKKDDIICAAGDDIETIYMLIRGKVVAYSTYGRFQLIPGSIVCLTDSYFGISVFNYVAEEDTLLLPISIKNISDVTTICNLYKDQLNILCINECKYIMQMVKNYLALIVKCRKKFPDYTPDNRINKWELDKYNCISSMPTSIFNDYYASNPAIAVAFLIETAHFAIKINDASLEMADFLNINMDYVPPKKEAPAPTKEEFNHSEEDFVLYEEELSVTLKDSLKKILMYSHMPRDTQEEFYNLMKAFKKLPDKLSPDESARRIRKTLTTNFYELYYAVFKASLNDDNIPLYIHLFLHFGYIDEELISAKNQFSLFKLSQNIDEMCNSNHVYTIYNWLKHIVWEEKEPSRNSLDQSYPEYIREQHKTGKLKITEDEALNDSDMKLKFEISNMFASTHRMTYGRASSFVPILLEENIYKPLESSLLTAEDIINTVNYARQIDFSLFYRTIAYSEKSIGIANEYIYKEILPDIILMPGLGSMSSMWQEIEGRQRNSSARIMLPILCTSDVNTIALNAFGKYRWELCKRIQGAYWNNLSEKSLTAEYYDYLQFYRKNRELSEAVKEKIKSTLINCRNNFTEVFAKDYVQWVMYESKGISKLNKISRIIFGRYCPFDTAIRENLKSNPAYNDTVEAYERHKAAQKKHFDLLAKSLIAKGHDIPTEIQESIEYLKR